MLERSQSQKGNVLITMLLVFYVLWKTPVVAHYSNTYLAMLLLVLLVLVFFLRDNQFLNHAPKIFGAAIALLILSIRNKEMVEESWLYIAWTGFLDFLPMALGALLIFYNKENQIKMLVPLVLTVYAITCVTTYIGLQEFPNASRELATGRVDAGPYHARNIGGFAFVYSLVIMHPMFVCVLWQKNKKFLSIALSVLIGICIFESKYTMAALTFFISCAAYILPTPQGRKTNPFRLVLAFVLMIIGYLSAPAILNRLAEMEVLKDSSEKIRDIARLLQGEDVDSQNMEARQEAYALSWEGFCHAPILGNVILNRLRRSYDGGHSFFLDNMARWGVIGLGFIIYILRKISQYYHQLVGGLTVRYYTTLSFALMMMLIFLNSSFWPYEMGFLIPVFAYYARMEEEKTVNDVTDTDSEENQQ